MFKILKRKVKRQPLSEQEILAVLAFTLLGVVLVLCLLAFGLGLYVSSRG